VERSRNSDREGLLPWKTVERKRIVSCGPWLEVWQEAVRLPDGRLVDDYYRIEQPDYVVVFPVADDGEVVCMWRYKHGPQEVCLGLPAGGVEDGEEPLDAAKRELLEEAGFEAGEWQTFSPYWVDGNRGFGRAHVLMARGLRRVAEPDSGDLEEMQLVTMSCDEFEEHILAGNVGTLGQVAAALLCLRHLQADTMGVNK
jgi:ADP-ribose pyrophosphatase